MSPFTDSDHGNSVKAATHGAIFTLASMSWLYNVVAWHRRRQPHLLVNAVVYGGLMVFEAMQITHHVDQGRS